MRWVLLIAVSLSCVACAKSHDITAATLGYEWITPRSNSVFFEVNFNSAVELMAIFWRDRQESISHQVLI
ncbi:hypothetical protein [Pseudomonas fluorescens]|uniref:Lipoprotein n=1 Tax=Pseudomonas fluorescens TaxID=294 RepID=A0A5E6TH00_PSEFL|nr:hypothetical protein [Pseudomonas fluorescens]VVM92669.1 hypothetical protein PS624_02901 [Pseudomonas fluorescens]